MFDDQVSDAGLDEWSQTLREQSHSRRGGPGRRGLGTKKDHGDRDGPEKGKGRNTS